MRRAEFRGVADRLAHARDAALIHQIAQQLHFGQAFEIGDFRGEASLHQRIESRLDQFGNHAPQNALFIEQIGLGFLLEAGFQYARAAATDGSGVGQRGGARGAAGILRHRNKTQNTASGGIFRAQGLARPLGRDKNDVEIGRRSDQLVMDGEAVRETDGRALAHGCGKGAVP